MEGSVMRRSEVEKSGKNRNLVSNERALAHST